ncbi:MAG: TolB family protein, partial [Planctomycetota bacterium]
MFKKTTSLVLALILGLASEVGKADFTFGNPVNLGPPVNSSNSEADLSISPKGLSLFFCSARPGGYGSFDIWVTTRATVEDDWGTPVNLGQPVNSPGDEGATSISADGLLLFFNALDRPGGYGGWDIWVTTRTITSDAWGTPVNLGPTVNSSYRDSRASISSDGLSLYFDSDRPGGHGGGDIWVTTRATTEDDWGTPVNFGPPVNSSSSDSYPNISADGLAFFFVSGRPGGFDDRDIWVTTRATTEDDWGTPVNLGWPANSSYYDGGPRISGDGSTLFFFSERSGGVGSGDIWQTPIKPVVDLNGDETVYSADMCIIVDHWGENYSLCDIGPMPWGDGIVDVEDLIILAEHLFEEFLPPELIAYWKLDETEGNIAYESISG